MKPVLDHLGKPLTSKKICEHLASMLGWNNTPPWEVIERDLRSKLARLERLEQQLSSVDHAASSQEGLKQI